MKKYIQDRKRKQDLWSSQQEIMGKRLKQVVIPHKSEVKAQLNESLTGNISTVNSESYIRYHLYYRTFGH